MRIKLTRRDVSLLYSLYENTFLSFYQIKDKYFTTKANTTVYNRLAKLIKAGVIKSIRINMIAFHKNDKDIGVVYTLTKQGLVELKKRGTRGIFRDAPCALNYASLYHDLLLTDVISKLKEIHPELQIKNSKILKRSFLKDEQIPDGVIFDTNTKQKYAIELELHAKSKSRYHEIITNYMSSSEYKKCNGPRFCRHLSC